MPCEQLEFPFEYPAHPSRGRLPRSRKAVPRKSRAQLATQAVKSKAVRRILAVVDAVSHRRGIDWQDVVYFHPKESTAATEARDLAMALCGAVEVPLCLVARLFSQPWAMVWEAENRIASRCLEHEAMGEEWRRYLESPGK